ncbi:DEAD/DEAH box helicase [Brucella anthropi]|uniref:DEAD/DEAH box helicase n=1 Tax=Brucella anthropi TaxID=529 RepID=UPI002164FDB6|nr:DEAD/DEAH box helicase [Brucella anthropi]UVV70950.1 DEAD/DEAH box helicase [Brucella anthropi]
MSFALELSKRLIGHEEFHFGYRALQRVGALAAMPSEAVNATVGLADELIGKLLYCANVFAQTEDESFKNLAQSIALNSLLVKNSEESRAKSMRLLSDLGNFPGVTFAQANHPAIQRPLLDHLREVFQREINTIKVGDEAIALTDFQRQAWHDLRNHTSVAISAPTSAGKSFLVIEHLCRLITTKQEYAAVYVAPTRALLSEVYDKVRARLVGVEGVRVSTIPTIDMERLPRQVYVLTQERLQVLLAATDLAFDLVVIDEAQNVSDGARGMILQECLEQALMRNSSARVVMLAPGAEGFPEIAKAVGVEGLVTSKSNQPSVLQNRIVVSVASEGSGLNLELLTATAREPLGVLQTSRGFDVPDTRLAAVALELGAAGGSLVYATGQAHAEKLAEQIRLGSSDVEDESLEALSKFIIEHIHSEYGLASTVKRGVAFHYGKMPSLLREAIENAFKLGSIKYLTCTTTLFQGINLPARNVFIGTPNRGRGAILDPAALWNFAGRAGRMRQDIVGNVFLVDYEGWEHKPMDSFRGYVIRPSFGETLTKAYPDVLKALSGAMPQESPQSDVAKLVRAAAGLLISRAAKGDIRNFLNRSAVGLTQDKQVQLLVAAESAANELGLPTSILATNWTVDPFGLKRLLDKMLEKIRKGEIEDLIPVNPHSDDAKAVYAGIFSRIQRYVNNRDTRFAAMASGTALMWMKGMAYPAIISIAIRRKRKTIEKQAEEYRNGERSRPPRKMDVNTEVRKVFDLIEDVIRFQFVQLGKAYVELLVIALKQTDHQHRIADIFDFPLALELGVATKSGFSFMELGLSRIAASTLESIYPNTALTVVEARQWLAEETAESLKVGKVILDELRKLKLIAA